MESSFVRFFKETRWSLAQVLEDKTYLFADTAIEFNNVKAWKMTEVGNKRKFRSR